MRPESVFNAIKHGYRTAKDIARYLDMTMSEVYESLVRLDADDRIYFRGRKRIWEVL